MMALLDDLVANMLLLLILNTAPRMRIAEHMAVLNSMEATVLTREFT